MREKRDIHCLFFAIALSAQIATNTEEDRVFEIQQHLIGKPPWNHHLCPPLPTQRRLVPFPPGGDV
jgi:hypothetical protein